jgi:hypothetical protein
MPGRSVSGVLRPIVGSIAHNEPRAIELNRTVVQKSDPPSPDSLRT